MGQIVKIIAAAGFFLLTGCLGKNGGNGIENYVTVGDKLPHFEVTGPSGTLVSPDAFDGKRAVVCLFRSTCPDCQRELPKVQSAWEEFGDDPGFVFAAISRGETAETVAAYWTENDLGIPYYLDEDKTVFAKFANSYVPRLYLVGTDGRIALMAIETFDFDADGLKDKIRELL